MGPLLVPNWPGAWVKLAITQETASLRLQKVGVGSKENPLIKGVSP